MCSKSTVAVVAALGAILLMANEVSAQHRTTGRSRQHVPQAFERRYGYVPREATPYHSATDIYGSDSDGHQLYPNPDRDFSIENLRSHPSQ